MTTRIKLFLLIVSFFLTSAVFAQDSGSLQKITLTSVTLTMDSVKTAQDAELVRNAVKKYPQVKDFDIKLKNCDFTLDNTAQTLDLILSDLAQIGQPAKVFAVRENQVFTSVPEENCKVGVKKVPDMSEEEVVRQGIQRKGGN